MLSIKDKIILVIIMMSKTIFIKIIVVTITGRKNGVGTAQCRGLAWQSFGIEKLAFFIIGNINIDIYRDEKEDVDDGDSAMMKGLPGLWR